MLKGLVLILFVVWGTKMVNSKLIADFLMQPVVNTTIYLLGTNDFPQLNTLGNFYGLERGSNRGYLIYNHINKKYLAVENPVYGERLGYSDTGTVFTLGDADCASETLDTKNPTQLMVEGLSGCITSEELIFTDPCNSSGWYLYTEVNCTEFYGQDCKSCTNIFNYACTECGSGLAVNGTNCAECPPGYEPDICGEECVEITTTTEVPTTDAPKDPTFNPIEVSTTNFSDLDISGAGAGSVCCKPIGVFIMLASFLSWVVLI